MKESRICPKCQSDHVMYPIGMDPRSEYPVGLFLKVTEPKDPGALIQLRSSERQEVKAAVCGNCGYLEWYTEKAESLWSFWQKGYR